MRQLQTYSPAIFALDKGKGSTEFAIDILHTDAIVFGSIWIHTKSTQLRNQVEYYRVDSNI